MRTDITPYELVKMANDVNIEVTTKLLVEKGLLSQGKNRKYLCIYHPDSNPDLGIYKKGNGVKCFVCSAYARGAKLYADALISRKFKNENLSLLLNYDMDKLKKSTLKKDKETLNLIRKIKKEQNLAIWEASINICYADNKITDSERRKFYKYLDNARKTDKIPKLYYEKTSKEGENNFGGYFHEGTGAESNSYELNNFSDVFEYILEDYDFDAIATREDIASVYSKYLDSIKEVRKKALRTIDYNHLKQVRGMSDEFIEFYGYVSFPTSKEIEKIMNTLLRKLKKANINPNILKKVPGFIYEKETKTYTVYKPMSQDGFYIPITDFCSNIKRLQIKLYGDLRYLWNATPGLTNCKSPITVRFPFGKNYKDLKKGNLKPNEYLRSLFEKIGIKLGKNTYVIGITEGEFKAVSMANELNIPILACQGLGSWPNFAPSMSEFMKVMKSLGVSDVVFLTGFDADTKVKPNLARYGRGLTRVLSNCEFTEYTNEKGETVIPGIDNYYITWDLDSGKGFDDVILAGNKDNIRLVPAYEYEAKDRLIKEYVALIEDTHPSQLTEVELKIYYEVLEEKSLDELESMVTKRTLLNTISDTLFGKNLTDLEGDEDTKMVEYMRLSNEQLEEILTKLRQENNPE